MAGQASQNGPAQPGRSTRKPGSQACSRRARSFSLPLYSLFMWQFVSLNCLQLHHISSPSLISFKTSTHPLSYINPSLSKFTVSTPHPTHTPFSSKFSLPLLHTNWPPRRPRITAPSTRKLFPSSRRFHSRWFHLVSFIELAGKHGQSFRS